MNKPVNKKLWEIEGYYHCSIIGTCLTLREVSVNLRKCKFDLPDKKNDYQTHSLAVSLCKEKNKFSTRIDTLLNRNFMKIVRDFNNCSTPKEVMALFKTYLSSKNIPGAFWAVMTHPLAAPDVTNFAFGEIHMLSHLNGFSKRAEIRKSISLEEKCQILEEQQKKYKRIIKKLKSSAPKPQEDLEKIGPGSHGCQELENKVHLYSERIKELESGIDLEILKKELGKTRKLLVKEEEKTDYLTRRFNSLKQKFDTVIKENKKFKSHLEKCSHFHEKQDPKEHTQLASKDIIARLHHHETLCGKCILLVGGKPYQIPTCKQVIEQTGADFIHHDGGVENSLQMLDSDISKADIILCPVNCVSHRACDKIKRSCKKQDKRIIYLKSAGISSILQELNQVVM